MSTRQREKAAVRRENRAKMGPQATLRWLRMSPQKVRLVVDLIRGKNIEEALNVLSFASKAAAKPIAKLVKSAVANADERGGFDLDKLYISTACVNEGQTWRRWLPRAMGRATRIRKRTSHITIVLAERAAR
jgi:large subunit ribosomal protein L22